MATSILPQAFLNGACVRTFSLGGSETQIRIPSTAAAVYLVVMNHRAVGDRNPYVAVVQFYPTSDVSIQQLTTNTYTLTATYTSTGGTVTGLRIDTPGYMTGFIIGSYDFNVTLT